MFWDSFPPPQVPLEASSGVAASAIRCNKQQFIIYYYSDKINI